MVSMDWHFFGTKVMNDPFMLFKDNKLGTLESINLNFTTTTSCFTSLKSLPIAEELLETLQISCMALNY